MALQRAEIEQKPRPPWTILEGPSPIIAAAIHNGHDLRPEVAAFVGIDEHERQREEDPHTPRLTKVAPTRVIANRSRFEIDLNRPAQDALCLVPDDCWGLEIWEKHPPRSLIEGSRYLH